MNKIQFAIMALATLVMVGCKDKNEPDQPQPKPLKDSADYVVYAKIFTYHPGLLRKWLPRTLKANRSIRPLNKYDM